MYSCGYKKSWGLYGINLDDDWYLQIVSGTIFRCSGTHFWTKFWTNQRKIPQTGSVVSTLCFSSNFPKGWGFFAKILYLLKMGENNYLTIVGRFFGNFIKIALFGRDDIWGFFGVTEFESSDIIELGSFLKAPGPLLARNTALSREQLAIQARQSHHDVAHLNCSKGWCSFAKILKSS